MELRNPMDNVEVRMAAAQAIERIVESNLALRAAMFGAFSMLYSVCTDASLATAPRTAIERIYNAKDILCNALMALQQRELDG